MANLKIQGTLTTSGNLSVGGVLDFQSIGGGGYNWLKKELFDYVHPVGSYIFTDDNNLNTPEKVSAKYGGTWVAIKDKFLIGAGNKYSVGSEGGNFEIEAVLPKHNHGGFVSNTLIGIRAYGGNKGIGNSYNPENHDIPHVLTGYANATIMTGRLTENHSHNIPFDGIENAKLNILNPYHATYIYRRTA